MIAYRNGSGEVMTAKDVYHIDILPELEQEGQLAIGEFRAGWFPAKPNYPAGIVYQMGSSLIGYASNRPAFILCTYYFEVRALTRSSLTTAAMDLCGAISRLYSAHRTQYSDAFDNGTYVKRITFEFTIELGE